MKSVFKQILREYEKDATMAIQTLRQRQMEVYKRVPRVLEIEDQLHQTGIEVAKAILQKGSTAQSLIQMLEQKNTALLQEREELLQKNGYGKDYFTNIYRCALCKDTGFIGAQQCTCFKQRLINEYYAVSNLENVLRKENFDTFDFRYYSEEEDSEKGGSPRSNIKRIYQSCLSFVSEFDRTETNLLFYGESGLGKTFLCNCIAKDILDRGKTVLYVTAPQLFKVIEDLRFHRESFEEPSAYIDLVYSVDLLVIDDLGTEVATIVTTSELFNIVNSRILSKKPCIISTNLHHDDLLSHYSDRLTSRFFGNYKMMYFFGEDIRLLKKYVKFN